MAKIIVLGGGMVGSAMAADLMTNHEVTLADVSTERLRYLADINPALNTVVLDAANESELKHAIADFDLVLSAVPGFMGFKVLRHIIEAGKNVVDISFFSEDSLQLHDLAVANNVTAIVDCGVAPGMDNLILGRYNGKMKLDSFECLVGGLPKVKKWPFCYKAPFSPVDVIEEYMRPARYVQDGVIVVREPMSEAEYVDFDRVGTLESFNTDGLRSIIYTMSHIPDMKEKTLRYPGHIEYVKVLKSAGFFDEKEINIGGLKIKPIDFTSAMLFKEWKLQPDEEEITVMRVTVKGKDEKGIDKKVIYNLYDEFNGPTKTSSMARTTGYTATAAANMLLQGHFKQKGVFPPELIGHLDSCFDFIMRYLNERGVVYTRTES